MSVYPQSNTGVHAGSQPGHTQSGLGPNKRLPNPVIVANEAIGYVAMCNDTRWRSYTVDDLKTRVKENREKFIGKQFVVGFLDNTLNGKRVQVCGMDQGRFHCELRSETSGSECSTVAPNDSKFAPGSRVQNFSASTVDSSDESASRKPGARSPQRNNSYQKPTIDDSTAEEDLTAIQELVKLNIANLVPVSSILDDAPLLKTPSFLGHPLMEQTNSNSKSKNNLTFDRVERKIVQAIFFFKGQVNPAAKDQTIFNREVFSNLNQRYRTDELHRLDILEMILKAKKFHFLNVQCKECCVWEDEERILKLDKINIETCQKRLRIKNIEAARAKHRLREQNVMYASALLAVRPACVGTGMVQFGQFDFGLPRDSKFENQLYTRFVKFVKYGMCERCQFYYLERGQQQHCQPVQPQVSTQTKMRPPQHVNAPAALTTYNMSGYNTMQSTHHQSTNGHHQFANGHYQSANVHHQSGNGHHQSANGHQQQSVHQSNGHQQQSGNGHHQQQSGNGHHQSGAHQSERHDRHHQSGHHNERQSGSHHQQLPQHHQHQQAERHHQSGGHGGHQSYGGQHHQSQGGNNRFHYGNYGMQNGMRNMMMQQKKKYENQAAVEDV